MGRGWLAAPAGRMCIPLPGWHAAAAALQAPRPCNPAHVASPPCSPPGLHLLHARKNDVHARLPHRQLCRRRVPGGRCQPRLRCGHGCCAGLGQPPRLPRRQASLLPRTVLLRAAQAVHQAGRGREAAHHRCRRRLLQGSSTRRPEVGSSGSMGQCGARREQCFSTNLAGRGGDGEGQVAPKAGDQVL